MGIVACMLVERAKHRRVYTQSFDDDTTSLLKLKQVYLIVVTHMCVVRQTTTVSQISIVALWLVVCMHFQCFLIIVKAEKLYRS